MAATDETDLQQRYTLLLEKRIAQLEALVNGTPKAPEAGKTSGESEDSNSPPVNGATQDKATDTQKDEVKPTSRYRNILRKWDRTAGAHKDEDVSEATFKKPDSKDIAYTFRRVWNPETGEKGAYSELDIEGEGLIALLRSVIDKYPGVNFDGDLVNINAPFAAIVHNWDKLQMKLKEAPESQARQDLEHLLRRIESAPELENYFKTRETNIAAQMTTYETLWTCFAPKTRVIAKPFMNMPQVLEVSTSPIPFNTPVESTLEMWSWCWDWDGKKMVRAYYRLRFDRFRGTKPINDLPFYPLEFDANKDDVCMQIRKRSEQYIKAIRVRPGASQMFTYVGNAYGDRRKVLASADEDDEGNEGSKRYSDEEKILGKEKFSPKVVPIDGEFICDAAAFLQYGSGSHVLGEWDTGLVVENPRESDGTPISLDLVKSLEDDTHQLFPPRLLGYATREKVWGQFAVDFTSQARGKNPKPFMEDLQLEPRYKEMIEALVDSHESNTDRDKQLQVRDVVPDKGKGLVLLLHGPPGVGKTLTAETIAQATGKPLFIVSVAEIGLNASRAERNLEKLFNLASKWEAILLVDEADVFLETRGTSSSAGRNALVSVLLRVLEYYQGIIILTTNRIKSIDVAVISRIHLAIRYSDLTESQMQKIFEFFLDQLEPDMIENRSEIDNFVENYGHQYGLNGRQIRNVVSGALASARNGKIKKKGNGKLTFKHLKDVCEMTKKFEDQLKENTMAQRYSNEAK